MMDILACPVCRGALELTVEAERGEEVFAGGLKCGMCNEIYPIKEGVPNLLPPDLRSI